MSHMRSCTCSLCSCTHQVHSDLSQSRMRGCLYYVSFGSSVSQYTARTFQLHAALPACHVMHQCAPLLHSTHDWYGRQPYFQHLLLLQVYSWKLEAAQDLSSFWKFSGLQDLNTVLAFNPKKWLLWKLTLDFLASSEAVWIENITLPSFQVDWQIVPPCPMPLSDQKTQFFTPHDVSLGAKRNTKSS